MSDFSETIRCHAERLRGLAQDMEFLKIHLKEMATDIEEIKQSMYRPTVRGVPFNIDADDQASIQDWSR